MKRTKEKAKEKKWILKSTDTKELQDAAAKISRTLGISYVTAKLLYTRGYRDAASAKKFICMEREMLANPFLMKDMKLGIERLHKAIVNSEKITVYGDYDVDGVTAVCTLYLYLKEKGANVEYYIPNRSCEGYGVSSSAIDTIKENGTKLVITVDTGITATEEVAYAKKCGIDFVITDHHECRSDIPVAEAVINPHQPDCNYPFKELAGVGVVFKFILAYEECYEGVTGIEAGRRLFDKYADLVAIGTIADVMPIKDENRLIVSYGLKMLEETERPGIIALIRASLTKPDHPRQEKRKKHTKITSSFIGYTLAPRINAAGRIKSAETAVELFLAEDIETATPIAAKLCEANRERQLEENKIIEEAYKTAEGSAGSAMREQEKWEQGLEAKTNKLKASIEELSTTLLDSDFLGGLVDTGRVLIDVLTKVIDKLGMIPSLLGAVGAGFGIKSVIKGDGKCGLKIVHIS